MARVHVQAKLSKDDLLRAIDQLDKADLDDLVHKMLVLRAKRVAPSLPHNESVLLQKINQGIPYKVQKRYDDLVSKRKAETLTSDEHAELLKLTNIVEDLEKQRIQYLAELAKSRRKTLNQVMEQLGIQTPDYA
jgi:transcriptional regulator of met regulon